MPSFSSFGLFSIGMIDHRKPDLESCIFLGAHRAVVRNLEIIIILLHKIIN
jgi:hypothetical protein